MRPESLVRSSSPSVQILSAGGRTELPGQWPAKASDKPGGPRLQTSASSCPSLTCLLRTCFHRSGSNSWHTHLSASGKPSIRASVGSSGHPSTMNSGPCICEERGGGSLPPHCVPCPRGKALSADVRHAGLVSAMFLRGSEQVACPDPRGRAVGQQQGRQLPEGPHTPGCSGLPAGRGFPGVLKPPHSGHGLVFGKPWSRVAPYPEAKSGTLRPGCHDPYQDSTSMCLSVRPASPSPGILHGPVMTTDQDCQGASATRCSHPGSQSVAEGGKCLGSWGLNQTMFSVLICAGPVWSPGQAMTKHC